MRKVQHFSKSTNSSGGSKLERKSPQTELQCSYESDFQSYCKLKEQLDGLFPNSYVEKIWQKVRGEYANCSPQEKYAIALSIAEDDIVNSTAYSSDVPKQPLGVSHGQSQETADSSESDYFDQFFLVFSDILDANTLQSIWNELDSQMSGEEKLEIASVFALDRLNERNRFSTKKFTAKSTKQRKKKNGKLTPQQECVEFIASVFEAEKLCDLTIQLALQDRKFNVEATIEHFCLLILKNGCFLRPNVSFADVVSCEPSEPSQILSSNSSSRKSAVVENSVEKPRILDTVRCPPLPHATAESEVNRRVMEHVFKPKNPHIKCSLSSTGEIVYEGTLTSFSRDVYADMYLLSIRMDLHGLTVYHSLSILESCFAYYFAAESEGRLWGRAGSLKIVLVLIVGKGLHSLGQRARLGPAIVKYLQEWEIKDFVYHEGEIAVQLKF